MAEDQAGPLDRRVLADIRALSSDDPSTDLVTELYGGWLGRIADRLDALQASLAAGELGAMAHQAHGLHGTAGSLGLAEVDARALALEEAASRADADETAHALDLLIVAVGRAHEALLSVPELRRRDDEHAE